MSPGEMANGRMGEMARWRDGEMATRSPGSVGRKTRPRPWFYSHLKFIRAGFEPFRGCGIGVGIPKFASSIISDI